MLALISVCFGWMGTDLLSRSARSRGFSGPLVSGLPCRRKNRSAPIARSSSPASETSKRPPPDFLLREGGGDPSSVLSRSKGLSPGGSGLPARSCMERAISGLDLVAVGAVALRRITALHLGHCTFVGAGCGISSGCLHLGQGRADMRASSIGAGGRFLVPCMVSARHARGN